MDAGWMLKVLSDFNTECQKSNLTQQIQNLIATHQKYMQQTNENTKNVFDKAHTQLTKTLIDSVSNNYTPSLAKIASELGLYDLMGNELLNAIEIRLANNLPQEVQPELQKILKDFKTKQQYVTQIINGMTGLNLSMAEIPSGEVQLNLIIPSQYKNDDYTSFIKANKEMLYIIDTMNHIVGNGACETKIVATRSGSLLMALLSNVDTTQALLDVVKTILEIIGMTAGAAIAIKKLQESEFSKNIIDDAIADQDKIFDRKIDKLKLELKKQYEENNKEETNRNFHIQINNSVNTLINIHIDGVQIEAISSTELDNENEEQFTAIDSINTLTSEINKLAVDVDAIKKLPYKPSEIDYDDE